jgi:hypothetical protein
MSDDADWMRGQVMMYGAPSVPLSPKWPNPPVYPFAPPGDQGTRPLPSSAGILIGTEDLANLRREMQLGFESIRAGQRDSIEELTRMFQAFLEMSLKAARREAYEEAVKICEGVGEGVDSSPCRARSRYYASAANLCAQKIKERAR